MTEAGLDNLVSQLEPPPLPTARPSEAWLFPLWGVLLLFLVLTGWGLWRWRQVKLAQIEGVLWAYGRLLHSAQKLGQPALPNQTPAEFTMAFLDKLARLGERSRLAGRLMVGVPVKGGGWAASDSQTEGGVSFEIERLTALYIARRYGRKEEGSREALARWRRIRDRLWFLRILNKVLGRVSVKADDISKPL